MKFFVNYFFRIAIPILIGMGCFLFSLSAQSQTRFNLRAPLNLEAAQFKGVVEMTDLYAVTGSGTIGTDSGLVQTMFHSIFSQEGILLDVKTYTKPTSFYLHSSFPGLNFLANLSVYSTLGQTYDENTESAAGFMVNFDETGDTNSVILFYSPYIELLDPSYTFIAPLSIEPSTNSDNSFFISSNIGDPENTGTDCWIQRMTPDGESLWSYIYATEANPDNCKAMLFTSTGGVLLAVLDNIQGTKLIELDSSGNEIALFDSEVLQGFNDMVRSADGSLIVSSLIQGLDNGWRPRVSKITIEGLIVWSEIFGTNSPMTFLNQEFTNLVHTQDGNYVAGGVNYAYVENPTDSTGTNNRNGWLVKVSDAGEVLWDRKYSFVNSPQDDHTLNDLKATSDGGFIFCGEATDYDPDLTFSEGPPQQGWLVKVDEYGCLVEDCQLTDNIAELSADQKEYFKAGPIPAGQFLNIYQMQNAPAGAVYQFIDMNGRVLEEFSAMSKGTTLMLEVLKFEVGGYLLVLMKDGEVLQHEKIIKE